MEYSERPPHPDLAHIVRAYWWLRGHAAGDVADPALPDGSPELILNLGDPWEQVVADGPPLQQPPAFLVGQISGPMHVRPTGRVDLVAVRLEAHAGTIFTDDIDALTDSWAPADALRPAVQPALRALRTACQFTHDIDEQVLALDDALRAALAAAPAPDTTVGEAVRAIRASQGAVEIDALAASLGVTARTLQRRFAQSAALSPKLLARIVRFQRVFAAWRDDPDSFARVAVECGYFDQSHLVRDFRDFAGAPPAGFLAALPRFTAFFTAARR